MVGVEELALVVVAADAHSRNLYKIKNPLVLSGFLFLSVRILQIPLLLPENSTVSGRVCLPART